MRILLYPFEWVYYHWLLRPFYCQECGMPFSQALWQTKRQVLKKWAGLHDAWHALRITKND